jgi:hypothetical protein
MHRLIRPIRPIGPTKAMGLIGPMGRPTNYTDNTNASHH